MRFWTPRSIHDDLRHWLRRLPRIPRPSVPARPLLMFIVACVLAFGLTVWLLGKGLPREAALMAGIFALAGMLWVTEALPLFGTALLVIGLEVILIANPGEWAGLGFEGRPSPDYQVFLAPLADPIIWLFLGGFLIAAATVKEGVDKVLAGIVLRPFQGSPARVMLGLMVVTAGFSLFMSNTATTAMMIALLGPVLAQIPRDDPARRGIVLSVPIAANVGGMGTPISSPPNAVAVGFLDQAGVSVSFLGWMLVAIPLVVLLLLFAWFLISARYRARTRNLNLVMGGGRVDRRGVFVLSVIVVTVALWMTDTVHGLPAAVVALVPAVAFTATGLIGRLDFNSLEWHILVLIAGGIALGVGMQATGLDAVIVEVLPEVGRFVLAPLAVATVVLGTLMSNTATANLLLPVAVAMSVSASGPDTLEAAVSIALAASMGMALPVSTPPNAIAFAQGDLKTSDLMMTGGIVGLVGVTLIVLLGGPIIRFWLG